MVARGCKITRAHGDDRAAEAAAAARRACQAARSKREELRRRLRIVVNDRRIADVDGRDGATGRGEISDEPERCGTYVTQRRGREAEARALLHPARGGLTWRGDVAVEDAARSERERRRHTHL